MHRTRKALLAAALTGATLVTFVVTADKAPAVLNDPSAGTISSVSMHLDGYEIASFSRCIGLGSESEVVASSQSGSTGEVILKSLPGKAKPGRTVCERGLTSSLELAAWRELAATGQLAAMKDVSVTMYNQLHEPTYRWHLSQTWPAELTNFFENGVGREIVTFVHQSAQRVSP
jgi:phage tail-like protein